MAKKPLFIINPRAGVQKISKPLLDIIQIFSDAGYLATALTTKKQNDATEFVLNYGADKDLIVCAGGDGTLNEVIAGLKKSGFDIPLGYLPAGSTNDFAASLDLPTDLLDAAREIVEGEVHHFDLGMLNERYFSYVACCGAFAKTSYGTPQNVKNILGHLAYLLNGVKDLPSFQKIHIKIDTDEQSYDGNYIYCGVSNSTNLGGVIKLDQSLVDMSDGLFEVMMIKSPTNPLELEKIVRALLSSNYHDCPMIEFVRTRTADFYFDSDVPWSIDGEYDPGAMHVHITNLPSALSLMKR